MNNLREIQPRRGSRADCVKVSFCSNYQYAGTTEKNMRCTIIIGENITNDLNWKAKDIIHVLESIESSNSGFLVLKKINSLPVKNRFTLRAVNNSFCYVINIPFSKEVTNKRIRTVRHEVEDMEDGQKCLKIWFDNLTEKGNADR